MHAGSSWTGRYCSFAKFIGYLRKKSNMHRNNLTQLEYYSKPSASLIKNIIPENGKYFVFIQKPLLYAMK